MKLTEYRMQKQYIDTLTDELERLRLLRDCPVQQGSDNMNVQSLVIRIVSLEEDIEEELLTLIDQEQELRTLISKMDNKIYRNILYKRYILCQSWRTIGRDLRYTRRYLTTLHRQAVDYFDAMQKDSP